MKTERELFVKYMISENPSNNIEFMCEFGWFFDPITELRWQAWQASASRDGYKLVPVETLKRTMGHICTAMHHPMNTRQEEDIMQSDMDIIEKAMTGAAP